MNNRHKGIAAINTASYIKRELTDILFITFGISLYAFGYTSFILPEKFVMGGVSGISALLYYAFDIPTALSIWILNLMLLLIGIRAINKQFAIRTVIGVSILSIVIGIMQPFFANHPVITIGEDRFMHVLIGGMLGGAGLGIVFSHNGSTGGTDIIVAWLNKKFSLSFGRAMQFIDFSIICSSYLLYQSTEIIIYGIAFTLIASVTCDYIINGTRQTVQFLIISKKYEEIADTINNDVNRGVTLLQGTGWFSKQDVHVLMVLTRKYESQEVLNYIKAIDPDALISQTFCHGVFGQGFDTIK